MSEEHAALGPTEIERVVVNWLREHPEFFILHPDLVESLRVPHPCAPAVSLLEYQNRLLRERGQRLHDKLLELVAIARDNDRLAERVQRLALDLLDAPDELDALLHRIKAALRDEFNADCAALCLDAALAAGSGAAEFLRLDALALFEGLLQAGKPRCGRLRLDQATALFGDCAPQVASAALVPLGNDQWRGLLALGSWDEQRFHPGAGTLFLGRAGELVGRVLRARLLAGEWRARSEPPSAHKS